MRFDAAGSQRSRPASAAAPSPLAAMAAPAANRCKVWLGNIPMHLDAAEVVAELNAYMIRPFSLHLQTRPFKDEPPQLRFMLLVSVSVRSC